MMSIKIVMYFIIIIFIPVASADNAWVAHYSGFIKSNQTASFENYLIKPDVLDNTRADITVYRNGNPIETREFYVNDSIQYGNIGVTLLGIDGDYSWLAVSKPENANIWQPLSRAVLNWGETYSIENYTFNFDTIGSNSVNLVVSNNGITEPYTLSINQSKDLGDLRFAVMDINRTGSVELEFFTDKPPAIRAQVMTDKDEYLPDENIPAEIQIASDGTQNIVGITLQTSLNAQIQPDRFATAGFNGTRSFLSNISGQLPNSTLTITATIRTRDYYNNTYVLTASKDISITPEVSIIKRVPADTDDENVGVELYVYNSGTDNKSIHVHDTVPEELGAKKLDWDIGLGAKNSTILSYNVTPQKPGLYILPAATAQWDGGSSVSKGVKMTMHMPYLSMIKTAVDNGSETDVKIDISNIGDRAAKVNVLDNIPHGYQVSGGVATMSGFVERGGNATVMYSLEGNIEKLPEADATYRDIRGVTRFAKSNTVGPEDKGITNTGNPGRQEILSFMIASFIAIAGIITGGALVAYLLVKRRK